MVGIQQLSQEQLTNVLDQLRKLIEGISEQMASSDNLDNDKITSIAIGAMAGKFQRDSESNQLIKTELKGGREWLTEVWLDTLNLHNNFEVPVRDLINTIKFNFEKNLRVINRGRERKIRLPKIDYTPLIDVLFLCLVLSVTSNQTED